MAGKRPIILKENKVYKKTNIPRMDLEIFFATNIVELKFKRRIKPPFRKNKRSKGHMQYTRRMLCTSNWRYVSSPIVRKYFNWSRPKTRRGPAWYRKRKLIIVWDILINGWRMISLEKYDILGYTPISKIRQQSEFTSFYRQHLKNLPEGKKKHFSDL